MPPSHLVILAGWCSYCGLQKIDTIISFNNQSIRVFFNGPFDFRWFSYIWWSAMCFLLSVVLRWHVSPWCFHLPWNLELLSWGNRNSTTLPWTNGKPDQTCYDTFSQPINTFKNNINSPKHQYHHMVKTYVSVYVTIYLSIYLAIYLSIYLSIYAYSFIYMIYVCVCDHLGCSSVLSSTLVITKHPHRLLPSPASSRLRPWTRGTSHWTQGRRWGSPWESRLLKNATGCWMGCWGLRGRW